MSSVSIPWGVAQKEHLDAAFVVIAKLALWHREKQRPMPEPGTLHWSYSWDFHAVHKAFRDWMANPFLPWPETESLDPAACFAARLKCLRNVRLCATTRHPARPQGPPRASTELAGVPAALVRAYREQFLKDFGVKKGPAR